MFRTATKPGGDESKIFPHEKSLHKFDFTKKLKSLKTVPGYQVCFIKRSDRVPKTANLGADIAKRKFVCNTSTFWLQCSSIELNEIEFIVKPNEKI